MARTSAVQEVPCCVPVVREAVQAERGLGRSNWARPFAARLNQAEEGDASGGNSPGWSQQGRPIARAHLADPLSPNTPAGNRALAQRLCRGVDGFSVGTV